MDRYRKEVIQVSTYNIDIYVADSLYENLYDKRLNFIINI